VISWVCKAFDAELVTPIGLTIRGEMVKSGESTTMRKLADAELIKIYDA
jgi:hypothetical protein